MQIDTREIALVIMGLSLVFPLMVYNSINQSEIVIVDMKRVLNQPAVLLTRSKMPEKDQSKVLTNYSALLPKVLADYGKDHHVTVISSPVIVSGNQDITDTIIEQTFERLKHDK